MARIRTIKPEFWTSPQVVECSPNARLLFIGLWNFCDDGGVTPAKTIQIKMRVFPGDAFTLEQVDGWLSELVSSGLLLKFEANNQQYYAVTGWATHQRIDKPSYRHPQPFAERSTNDPGTLGDDLPPEGKGMERNGKEKEHTSEPGVPPCPHLEIISAYHEILHDRPRIVVNRWGQSPSAKNLLRRWRENDEHRSVDWWRGFFEAVRTNDWWMNGKEDGWKGVDLHWLVKRGNFDKVVQHWANLT